MGLSVSHIKLTSNPLPESEYLYIVLLEVECNLPPSVYSKYITTINEPDYSKTIAVFNNKKEYEQLMKTGDISPESFIKVLFSDNNKELDEQIKTCVKENTLVKLGREEYFLVNQKEIEYRELLYGEYKQEEVIYYNIVGEQNKGMGSDFYKLFKDGFYGYKEDFELAYTCVGKDWVPFNENDDVTLFMRKNFKENFLDNYVFGESLFDVSF